MRIKISFLIFAGLMDGTQDRIKRYNELKCMLTEIDGKLLDLTKDLGWDYKKFLTEEPLNMVTCSINNQHLVPISKLKAHEEKCSWHQNGYSDHQETFPEHSGCGSFISLTSELLNTITKNDFTSTVLLYLVLPFILLGFQTNQNLRSVPQTSANFDQNFNREEKLRIYDFVIANTQHQKSYSDLWLQSSEKKQEKKEMTEWEIAAAERDAKRRRASYRNKVHTNRKTHTEILREVIESQMETFKEDNETAAGKYERQKYDSKKITREERYSEDKRKHSVENTSRYRSREGRSSRDSHHERHSQYSNRPHRRSPSITGSNYNSRSRSHDKYRKLKTYEGRSRSHKSSKD